MLKVFPLQAPTPFGVKKTSGLLTIICPEKHDVDVSENSGTPKTPQNPIKVNTPTKQLRSLSFFTKPEKTQPIFCVKVKQGGHGPC